MKKVLALLLAVMMVVCFAACGGEGDTTSVGIVDSNGNDVTTETIDALTEAYNAIAVPYNDIATMANENGWAADEQTLAELDAMSTTLGFVGAGLTEDITMLDGTDFDALIDMLENEVPEALDILSERVSVPYEG